MNTKGVIQGDVGVAIPTADDSSLGLTTWYNIDATDETDGLTPDDNALNVTEVDLIVDYTQTFDQVEGAVGLINYSFPSAGGSTSELFASASTDLGGLNHAVTLYHDIDNVGGLYLAYALSKGLPLSDPLMLTLSAGLGWMSSRQADVYFGANSSGFSDLGASARLDYTLDEATTLFSSLSFVTVIDDEMKDSLDDGDVDDSGAWLMAGVGWSF